MTLGTSGSGEGNRQVQGEFSKAVLEIEMIWYAGITNFVPRIDISRLNNDRKSAGLLMRVKRRGPR